MKRIRILIIDESVLCRDVLGRALSDEDDVELLGAAPNGKTGLDRASQHDLDLLVVSSRIENPDAVEVTRRALTDNPNLGVLVTTYGDVGDAEMVVNALEAGAFDFVIKPEEQCVEKLAETMKRRLLPKIRSFSTALYSRLARSLSAGNRAADVKRPLVAENSSARAAQTLIKKKKAEEARRFRAVVIGVSTGGPEALARLVPALPGSFPLPVVVVLHMPELFTASLATNLNDKSRIKVREACDGDILQAGTVYLAPGGSHLVMKSETRSRLVLRLSDDPPENGCKPSADVLFRSAADACPKGLLALILTGMGNDGVEGLVALKQADAYVLAQDEESSVVWGMPGSAVHAGLVDEVLPLSGMADRLQKLVSSNTK